MCYVEHFALMRDRNSKNSIKRLYCLDVCMMAILGLECIRDITHYALYKFTFTYLLT